MQFLVKQGSVQNHQRLLEPVGAGAMDSTATGIHLEGRPLGSSTQPLLASFLLQRWAPAALCQHPFAMGAVCHTEARQQHRTLKSTGQGGPAECAAEAQLEEECPPRTHCCWAYENVPDIHPGRVYKPFSEHVSTLSANGMHVYKKQTLQSAFSWAKGRVVHFPDIAPLNWNFWCAFYSRFTFLITSFLS